MVWRGGAKAIACYYLAAEPVARTGRGAIRRTMHII